MKRFAIFVFPLVLFFVGCQKDDKLAGEFFDDIGETDLAAREALYARQHGKQADLQAEKRYLAGLRGPSVPAPGPEGYRIGGGVRGYSVLPADPLRRSAYRHGTHVGELELEH